MPAGSGTFMSSFYSRGQNGVHNVETCSPWLCQGKLDLSNTWDSRKTLSFSKPPHEKSSFAAFRTVPDEVGLPGKGKERNPSGFLPSRSARFRTFLQEGLNTGPNGPVPIQHEPAVAGSFRLFQLYSLGQEALEACSSPNDASWASRPRRLSCHICWVL